MKVLVTGGAGYIGSVCVEHLLDLGHAVWVFDNLEAGHRSAVDKRARLIFGDLRDASSIQAAVRDSRPEAVIHFAARALVGESMERPGLYFHNNVTGGLHLLEAMRSHGVRKLVFSSTCATYGVPERVPMDETLAQRPINPYGESKLMFERILEWYRRLHGIESVIFRYFNAAGASERLGEHHRVETHLIPNVLRVGLQLAPRCVVYGAEHPTPDGTCIRDYVHVLDLASAHELALAPGRVGAFNLGTGIGYSVLEVIRACEEASGRRIPHEIQPPRPGDPPRLVAAADKARTELGWDARSSTLAEIVGSAWKWHAAHPSGYPD